MVYEYRHQPWFSLYVAYQLVTTTLFRLPYWYAVSYPQSWRPRPSWSLKRSVLVRLFRHLFHVTQKTGALTDFPTHRAIRPGPGVKAVWVDPCPHLITGDLLTLACAANVRCARIPGYWIDKDPTLPAGAPPQPGDKLLYRLHGGSYIQLSAHPSDPTANIARGMLDHAPSLTRTFAVEYRLSSAEPYEPANPFPAALLDALAGYSYLVHELGFCPADIVVLGDSAGGNLALALMRYLRDSQVQPRLHMHTSVLHPLPLPHALILLSPWTDLSPSHFGPNTSIANHYTSDYTTTRGPLRTSYAKLSFLGPFGFGFAGRSVYVSPGSLCPAIAPHATFEGFPRTWICAGSAEPLIDSIQTLWWRVERDIGKGREDGGGMGWCIMKPKMHCMTTCCFRGMNQRWGRRCSGWPSGSRGRARQASIPNSKKPLF